MKLPEPGTVQFEKLRGYRGSRFDLPKVLKLKRHSITETLGMVFYETILQSVDAGSVCARQGFEDVIGLAVTQVDHSPVNSLNDITAQLSGKLEATLTFGVPNLLFLKQKSGIYIGGMIVNGVDANTRAHEAGAVPHLGSIVMAIDKVPVTEATLMKAAAGKPHFVASLGPPPKAEISKVAVVSPATFQRIEVNKSGDQLILKGPRTLELAPFIGCEIWTVNGKEVKDWNSAAILKSCGGIAAIAITFYEAKVANLSQGDVEDTIDIILTRPSPTASFGITVTIDGILESVEAPNERLKQFINCRVYGCNNRLMFTIQDLMGEMNGRTTIKLQFRECDGKDFPGLPYVEMNSSETSSSSSSSIDLALDDRTAQVNPAQVPSPQNVPYFEPVSNQQSLTLFAPPSPRQGYTAPSPPAPIQRPVSTSPIPATVTVAPISPPRKPRDYEARRSQYWQDKIKSLSKHRVITTYQHSGPVDVGVLSPESLQRSKSAGRGRSRQVTITASAPYRSSTTQYSDPSNYSYSEYNLHGNNNFGGNDGKRSSQKITIRAVSPSPRHPADDHRRAGLGLNKTYTSGATFDPRPRVAHLGGTHLQV
eukprot:TRINITY_DN3742_c1_g1_i1.p1 TRINITY_DN3742_c1_g1~~TRINITY_DN3742_c1_g1_i1.p1  ORF type:complete len:611 (+),score=76.13 TRINITY_DN3742_c1_g1_i1:54-1835(+)